ncbi:Hypothetical protein A7982_10122 [Minicystis rosea]|nr:Hypothetical protein A7982_10122 [Minicystis rosea]
MHRDVSIERLVRRLSIDLRGTVPDATEYDAVAGKDTLPDEVLQSYLDSDAFRIQMRRYHEDLLWTNPTATLGEVGFALSTATVGTGTVYFVTATNKRKLFRGGDGTHNCQDKPQSTLGWDANGLPIAELMGTDTSGDFYAEGWVDVHPYWEPDPKKTIRVCAFDAQQTETYTLPAGDVDAGTHTCDDQFAVGKAKSCGCGPDLAYCMTTAAVQGPVLAAMREQLLRLVDDSTDGTRPYSDIVTTKRSWINGPLTHYFRYLAARQTLGRVQNIYQPSDGPLPDLAFTAGDTWVEVEREEPHSGILTLPAYLLRFQTNRGRANRYRIAFEGQYFQPPSTIDTGCNKEGEDLTQRCVCRNCHSTLEPLAAHFGLFIEAGTTSLRDFTRNYDSYKACAKAGPLVSNGWCDRYYAPVPDTVDPDIRPYKLKALRYADKDHPAIGPNFDAGPVDLVKQDLESGVFHQVATRHMFELLMKREPNLDPTSADFEGELVDEIAKEFQAHDNLKLLVTRLVKLPMYRRMP